MVKVEAIVEKVYTLLNDVSPKDLGGHYAAKVVTRYKRLAVTIDQSKVWPPGSMVDIRGKPLGNAALEPVVIGRQVIEDDVERRYLQNNPDECYVKAKPRLPRFAISTTLTAKAMAKAKEQVRVHHDSSSSIFRPKIRLLQTRPNLRECIIRVLRIQPCS